MYIYWEQQKSITFINTFCFYGHKKQHWFWENVAVNSCRAIELHRSGSARLRTKVQLFGELNFTQLLGKQTDTRAIIPYSSLGDVVNLVLLHFFGFKWHRQSEPSSKHKLKYLTAGYSGPWRFLRITRTFTYSFSIF